MRAESASTQVGTSRRSLTVYYQNVRGLNTKVTDFFNAVASSNFSFIAVTETWLSAHVSNAELFPSAYTVFRSDRKFSQLGLSRGGGALLAVRDGYEALPLDLSGSLFVNLPSVDIVGAKVALQGKTLTLVCVYVPPNFTVAQYNSFFDALSSVQDIFGSYVLLLGDFNLSGYVVSRSSTNPPGAILALNNFLTLSHLSQHCSVVNDYDHILDLVISDLECIVEKAVDLLVDEDLNHPALAIHLPSLHLPQQTHNAQNSFVWNFKKGNLALLYSMLEHSNWSAVDHFSDPVAACKYLYERVDALFEISIPKTRLLSGSFPPWFNGSIIRKVRIKHRLWSRFRRSRTAEALSQYREHRSSLRNEIRCAHAGYLRQLEESISSDPANFWKHISSKRSSDAGFTLRVSGEQVSDSQGIADAFAIYFMNSYVPSSSSDIDFDLPSTSDNTSFHIDLITEEEVLSALKRLKGKPTAGPDNIPSFILRDCCSVFTTPLTKIFNLCLRTSIFPDVWKLSKLCPVFKKGDRADVSNYRPITIISNFAKVFESVLYTRMYNFFSDQLVDCQHGFVAGRSTVTNLLCVSQYIANSLDRRLQCDVIYTDFSKAFDRLDHGILLTKLRKIGLSPDLLSVFKSFLCNRKQFVSFRGHRSSIISVTSGVPQGSILGPLLFNIFVNDIVDNLDDDVHCLLYADDLKLYSQITCIHDCRKLQHNLDMVFQWCELNRLYLNPNKCSVMSYGLIQQTLEHNYNISGSTLNRPDTVRDLGVIFDPKMSFIGHINHVVGNAFKMLGFIMRNCRDFAKGETLVLLYNSFVRSRLEYACIVWEPYYDVHINSLESVQRRFLKYLNFRLTGVYPYIGYPHVQLLLQHSFESLSVRRQRAHLLFLHKLVRHEINCMSLLHQLQYSTPRPASRYPLHFYLPTPRTNILKFSPLYRLCDVYNKVCHQIDLYNCTVSSIRTLLL